LTVSKLWVRGELPDDHRDQFLKHIRRRAFEPLTPDDDTDERAGWCVVGSPLDLELDDEKVFFGSYVALGVRVDRWRLPSGLFKAQLADAMREMLTRTGRERLSRAEKDDLKLRVATRMKKKTFPAMRQTDFVWNLDRQIAFFWSHSQKTIDQLSVLFEQTFGLELALDCPYLAAVERGLSEPEVERLDAVEPTPFHAGRR
jgi:DNA recombination-dependent growth factor C